MNPSLLIGVMAMSKYLVELHGADTEFTELHWYDKISECREHAELFHTASTTHALILSRAGDVVARHDRVGGVWVKGKVTC